MESSLVQFSYEIELQPGEKLNLPRTIVDAVGAGRWRITVESADQTKSSMPRDHGAFLNSYAAEDEGLYDDCATR